MPSERLLHLLTAAVDGELSSAERKLARKVLRRSSSARKLFRAMQQDAKRLQNLPHVALPADLSAKVMQAITARPLVTPTPAATHSLVWRSAPLRASLAAAAAVLVVVSAGSYMYFATPENSGSGLSSASRSNSPLASHPTIRHPIRPELAEVVQTEPDGTNTVATQPKTTDGTAVAVEHGVAEPTVVEPGAGEVLTTPLKPGPELFRVEAPKLPPVIEVRDLDKPETQARLKDALNKDGSYNLDLFSKDANQGFERLQVVLQANQSKLLIDAVAQARLQRKLKTHYVLYSEQFTVEELVSFLGKLAAEERKHDGPMDKLVIRSVSTSDQKALSLMLGLDPKAVPIVRPHPAHDVRKPLSDSTLDQVTQSLQATPRPGSATAKAVPKTVLVMPFNPIRPNPGSSKEVKQFLESRKTLVPSAVPILIVIRQSDG